MHGEERADRWARDVGLPAVFGDRAPTVRARGTNGIGVGRTA
jgi:hypothetical protein